MHNKSICLVIVLMLLSACTTMTTQTVPVEERDTPVPFPTETDTQEPVDNVMDTEPLPGKSSEYWQTDSSESAVVVALMDDARHALQSGEQESAAAALERALRLEPKNALLWHRLGNLRLQQEMWQQALVLAQKSNSLAAGNQRLQAANWQIIAVAKSALGDQRGAGKARQKFKQLNTNN